MALPDTKDKDFVFPPAWRPIADPTRWDYLPPNVWEEWGYGADGGDFAEAEFPPTSGETEEREATPPTIGDLDLKVDCLLQNVRFLKDIISADNWANWLHNINSFSMLRFRMDQIAAQAREDRDRIDAHRDEVDDQLRSDVGAMGEDVSQIKNTMPLAREIRVGITREVGAEVSPSDVLVKFTYAPDPDSPAHAALLKEDQSIPVQRVTGNIYKFDLSGQKKFSEAGEYFFTVSPRRVETKITDIGSEVEQGSIIYVQQNMFQDNGHTVYAKNELYGWNLIAVDANGIPKLGETMIIVGNEIDSKDNSRMALKITPALPDFGSLVANDKLYIWKNLFTPLLVRVIVRTHDIEALGYATYAKREQDCETSEVIIYDHKGEVYRRFDNYKTTNEAGHESRVRELI